MPAKKKKKSTVNASGNYTKPTMRKRLFNQLLAKKYKAAGGGYRGKKK